MRIIQPFEPEHAQRLADVHRNLGESYRIKRNYKKALQEFEAAAQIDEKLVAAAPKNARYAVNLGKSKFCLALVLDRLISELEGYTERELRSRIRRLNNGKKLSKKGQEKYNPSRIKSYTVLTKVYLSRARRFKERFVKAPKMV